MQAVFRRIWSPNMHPSENRGLRAGTMRYFWERDISGRKFISSAECILGEPGATSRNDAIFLGERHFARKYLLPKNIASFRLAPPWSLRMRNMGSHFSRCSAEPGDENRAACISRKENKCWFCVLWRKLRKALEKMFYLFVSNTNAHAIRGKPTPKYHERFRNGSIHEFHCLKEMKTLKEVDTSDLKKEKWRNFDFDWEPDKNKKIVMQDKGLNDSI